MTIVVDASAVAGALLGHGPQGAWAESILVAGPLAAPAHMPVEVANVLRRAELAKVITRDVASIAHGDLLALPVQLFAYEGLAERAWQLRLGTTCYDGAYVALAEQLDAPLATLDGRLVRASGPRCRFATPPA